MKSPELQDSLGIIAFFGDDCNEPTADSPDQDARSRDSSAPDEIA